MSDIFEMNNYLDVDLGAYIGIDSVVLLLPYMLSIYLIVVTSLFLNHRYEWLHVTIFFDVLV